MKKIFRQTVTNQNMLLASILIVLILTFSLISCTDSSNKKDSQQQQSKSQVEKKKDPLIGTWVSQKWPEQKYIFTKDEIKYREENYSYLLEESGKYTREKDGSIEWSITWYSGGHTRWKGKLDGKKMDVEFVNSWEGTLVKDTLNKIPDTN